MNNIALTMSDVGFREATFSVGRLSYLNHLHYDHKPLPQYERFIGTPSGESFTNSAHRLRRSRSPLKLRINCHDSEWNTWRPSFILFYNLFASKSL